MCVKGVGVPHATVAGVQWNYASIMPIKIAKKPTSDNPAIQYSSDIG